MGMGLKKINLQLISQSLIDWINELIVPIVTTINSANYLLLETDQLLDVQHSGPVEITAPNAERDKIGRSFIVSDAFRNEATTWPIKIKNEYGAVIWEINGDGGEVTVRSNGTSWG